MTERNNSSHPDPTEYRDKELAARFSADPVPEHEPSFWNRLEADLTGSHRSGSDTAVMDLPDTDSDLISLDSQRVVRRESRALHAALVAAAVLVVAAIGAAAWYANADTAPAAGPEDGAVVADVGPVDEQTTVDDQSDDDGTGTDTTVDAPDTSQGPAADSPFPVVDYSAPVRVDLLGDGTAIGTTPDGRAILVVDDDRDNPGSGCEGATPLMLYAQDITTGERRRVLPAGMAVETGGLEFTYVDYARPLGTGGEAVPVAWTDYCDGERNDTWTAQMAPDGTISRPVSIPNESDGDPFAKAGTMVAVARGTLSTDGFYVLDADGGPLTVRTVNPNDDQEWEYRGAAAESPRFAPAGDAVVFNSGGQTTVWRYRSDEQWSVPTDESTRYSFGLDGRYVFINSFDPSSMFGVLDYSGGPPPVYNVDPDRCSGTADLAPLTPADDLPVEVADAIVAIDEAAADCDWTTLDQLAGAEFTASFGGGEATQLWTEAESRGETPMFDLRILLRQPHLVDENTGTEERYFVWPSAFGKECTDLSDADRRSLADLGYSDEQLSADCEFFGGYAGLRTGVTGTGRWLYLVAGD